MDIALAIAKLTIVTIITGAVVFSGAVLTAIIYAVYYMQKDEENREADKDGMG